MLACALSGALSNTNVIAARNILDIFVSFPFAVPTIPNGPTLHGPMPGGTSHRGHWGGSIAGSEGIHNADVPLVTRGSCCPNGPVPQ